MIPIYLCEDDVFQLKHLKNMIEKLILISSMDMKVVCAVTGPAELLNAMPDRAETAAYFLDIDLCADMDGIELAVKIRERDPRAFIIFTTTHSEMAVITFRYKVEALDFLMKDSSDYQAQLGHCLQNILEKSRIPASSGAGRIRLHLPERDIYLQADDILYLETTAPHQVTFHTVNGIYPRYGTLKEYENLLDDRFVYCHRSILVNTGHISALSKESGLVVFDNAASCPCALRKFSVLRKILLKKDPDSDGNA